MGLSELIRKIKGVEITEKTNQEYDQWDIKNIGNIVVPEKLSPENSFMLANTVTEIFFPIDFYADRISKLNYFIAYKSTGKPAPNNSLNRFITDINPLYSFSDLVYQYVFSLLSDGNVRNYLGVPSLYKNISADTIERWDVINPNMLTISEWENLSILDIRSQNELIRKAEYIQGIGKKDLDVSRLFIHSYNNYKRNCSNVLSISPLFAANKSIDTLLAVYSARYNVYANNGAAGYLARKSSQNGVMDLNNIGNDDGKRQEILDDINKRNGLTGKKNIWGISGVPIEFVKTLATISELMPLEETLENSIKISSIFQIPAVLVPRKDQSTFSNQADAEKSVWENGLMSVSETVNNNLTKLFCLDKTPFVIMSDYSGVSSLAANEVNNQDLITKKLANLDKIKALDPELDINIELQKIFLEYGS